MKHADRPKGFAMPANASQPLRRRVRSLCAAFIAFGVAASLIAAPALAANATSTLSNDGTVTTASNETTTGLCTPKDIHWGGTDIASGTVDTGIATYVGGDMYVGKNTGGTMQDTNGPSGSYAVEAEGLTAVKGKLLLHPLKTSWTTWKDNGGIADARGFRFGTVGFGAQFRPDNGKSVLEVYGQSSNTNLNWLGGAQAWGNAGWLGKLSNESSKTDAAHINGNQTKLYSGTANDFLGKYGYSQNTDKYRWDDRYSVYVPSDATGTLKWGKNSNTIGDTGEVFTSSGSQSSFGDQIENMSQSLEKLGQQGSVQGVYVANAEFLQNDSTYKSNEAFERSKYLPSKATVHDYTYKISSVDETVIKFVGDGSSGMQVFNLDSSKLDSSKSYSYAFEKIPDTASVVINVTGSNAQTLSYHNGWRFWWTDMNGNRSELGGSYNDAAYAKRAQQILWNFPDTTNLTIQGGQAAGNIQINKRLSPVEKQEGVWGETTGPATTAQVKVSDDPAAGLLGSVLVPKGSFESHVSTNGRVWVGGDFSMYNPTIVKDVNGSAFVNFERSHTASAIDMDQERHNLPWNGSYTAQCATLAWDKVSDDTTHSLLKGTTWAVYGSLNAAKNNDPTQALKRVTDGQYGDEDNQNDGHFEVSGLNPSDSNTTLTYYLREVATNDTKHRLNSNIYAIDAGTEGTTVHKIMAVYDTNGTKINDASKKLLVATQGTATNDQIINESKGIELSWSKVDKDATGKTLAGSVWKLQKQGSNVAYHITDTTKSAAKVTVKHNGKAVTTMDLNTTDIADLTAEVTDANGSTDGLPQRVAWTSSNAGVATVNADSGLVTPIAAGTTIIKACSVMDTTVCASVTVTVTGKSEPVVEDTTTVYYPANVFGTGNAPTLHYSINGSVAWADAVMELDSTCANWYKTTFTNTGHQKINFVVHYGDQWDNNGGSSNNYVYAGTASTITLNKTNTSYAVAGTLSEGTPSGCSVDPPASSETVTITSPTTSSITLDKGKTLALTATKTPSSATLTWSSGNTSVATVEADSSDDTKATLTALAVGTATIRVRTAGGAAASITVTVRDGTQLTVYFKTNAVNDSWTNGYWLAYQQKSNGIYATVKMEPASCDSEYVVAAIPRDQVKEGYGYYFRDNGRLDNKRQWYGSNGVSSEGDVFQFPGGSYTSLRVESNSTKQTSAPSSCATRSAAKSAARTRVKASAKANAKTNTKASTKSTATTAAKAASSATAKAAAQQGKTGAAAAVPAVQTGESGVSATADTGTTGSADASAGVSTDTATETIYSCGDTQGRCDMDATVGGFRIVDLEAGTYTLTEVVEPNGFAGTAASYTVTINADGSTTWNPALTADSTAGANKVPNTRMTGTVTWNKVTKVKQTAGGSEQSVKLGGTEWSITKVKSFAWGADGTATYTELTGDARVTHTITDCVDGQSTDAQGTAIIDCSTQSATEATPYVDMDGTAGQFKLTGLDWGTYELKETKAPEGYTVDGATRTFTFGPAQGSDMTGQWYQNTVDDADGTTAGTAGTTTSAAISTKQVDYDQQVFMFAIGDIANARTLGTVAWQKVGSDDETKPLAGSQWKLVQKTAYDTAKGIYVELANEQTYDVIDCITNGTQSPCGTGAGTGESGEKTWNDSDSEPGKFKLEQLPWGKYSLVETFAPKGYTPKAEEMTFTVGPTKAGQESTSQDQTSSEAKLLIDLGSVVNQKTVIATAIPMTGGDWTGRDILAVGGGLALLAGICAMAWRHSRRKVVPHAQPRL